MKDLVVAALFLGGAAYLLFVPESKAEEQGERRGGARERQRRGWKEITTAFVVIFIGEFGDLTQIQAANFEAKTPPAARGLPRRLVALVVRVVLGAYGGKLLQRVMPLARIRLGGGLIFAGLGLWTLVHVGDLDEPTRRTARLRRDVKGFMPRDEGLALFELRPRARRRSHRGTWLEVGAWCGKSAVYLGAAAEATASVLYSLDHHHGSEENQEGWEHFDRHAGRSRSTGG